MDGFGRYCYLALGSGLASSTRGDRVMTGGFSVARCTGWGPKAKIVGLLIQFWSGSDQKMISQLRNSKCLGFSGLGPYRLRYASGNLCMGGTEVERIETNCGTTSVHTHTTKKNIAGSFGRNRLSMKASLAGRSGSGKMRTMTTIGRRRGVDVSASSISIERSCWQRRKKPVKKIKLRVFRLRRT